MENGFFMNVNDQVTHANYWLLVKFSVHIACTVIINIWHLCQLLSAMPYCYLQMRLCLVVRVLDWKSNLSQWFKSMGWRLPYERDRDVPRLTKGCKLRILTSLRCSGQNTKFNIFSCWVLGKGCAWRNKNTIILCWQSRPIRHQKWYTVKFRL